jgi:hypothetical protein
LRIVDLGRRCGIGGAGLTAGHQASTMSASFFGDHVDRADEKNPGVRGNTERRRRAALPCRAPGSRHRLRPRYRAARSGSLQEWRKHETDRLNRRCTAHLLIVR